MPGPLSHDLRTGQRRTLTPGATNADVVDISPDGQLLALTSADGLTTVFDLRTQRLGLRFQADGDDVANVRFSDDGRRLLAATGFLRLTTVWDIESGAEVAQIDLGNGSDYAVDVDSRGRTIVSAGRDNALRRWDVDGSRSYLKRTPIDLAPACFVTPASGGQFVAYTHCVRGLDDPARTYSVLEVPTRHVSRALSLGNGFTLGGGSWDPETGQYLVALGGTVFPFDGHTGRVGIGRRPASLEVTEVDHSPDGSRVVMAELSGRVSMLDARSLREIGTAVEIGGSVCCVSAGADNRTAFALGGASDPDLSPFAPATHWSLVDLAAGEVLDSGALGLEAGTWAALSPTGRHAAVGGADGSVVVIDLHSGEPVRPPVDTDQVAFWVAFSPDGSRFVTGHGLGSVVLWDPVTGTPAASIVEPNGDIVSAEFMADGTSILVTPWNREPRVDSGLYVWNPTSERAVEFACQAAGRDLTEEEWRSNFGSLPYHSTCPNQGIVGQ